jgi:hypothetical protein
MAVMSRLLSGWPGTMAGPVLPPFSTTGARIQEEIALYLVSLGAVTFVAIAGPAPPDFCLKKLDLLGGRRRKP